MTRLKKLIIGKETYASNSSIENISLIILQYFPSYLCKIKLYPLKLKHVTYPIIKVLISKEIATKNQFILKKYIAKIDFLDMNRNMNI